MIFEKLLTRAEIINEARKSRFETLFSTDWLKGEIADKKIGTPRPLVFRFILEFLKEKGLVPEDQSFRGSNEAAKIGQVIVSLMDSGKLDGSISDEFRDFAEKKLGNYIGLQQQISSRGKGANTGRTFEPGEFQKFKTVRSPEEYKAEKEARRQAKRDAKRPVGDLPPDSEERIDQAYNKASKIVAEEEWDDIRDSFLQKIEEDDSLVGGSKLISSFVGYVIQLANNADIITADQFVKKMLTVIDSLDEDKFVKLEPTFIKISNIFKQVVDKPFKPAPVLRNKTHAQQTGVDGQGYNLGSFGQPDEQRTEDEEVPVKESYKKKEVKYITNRNLNKPSNIWQQIQLQNEQFRK